MEHQTPRPNDPSRSSENPTSHEALNQDRTAVYNDGFAEPNTEYYQNSDPGGNGYLDDRPEPRFANQDRSGGSDQSRIVAIAAAIAVLVAVLVGLVIFIATSGSVRVETDVTVVPSVVGESQADATNRLIAAGFTVTVEFREDQGEPGTVFAQIPEAGAEHDPAEPVTLFVVAGDETVDVPNVVDRQTAAARTELADLGFTVRVNEEPSDEVDAGRVIRQSVEAGQQANLGSEITITVSTGPASVDVPDLTNQTQANAEQALINAGFVPRVELVDVPAGDPGIGQVIAQVPGAGQTVTPGAEIIIRVGQANSSTTTTTTTQATTTTASNASTTVASSEPNPKPEGPFPDSRALLLAFSDAWTDGDWDRLGTMANDDVVTTARDLHTPGGEVLVNEDNIASVLEACTTLTPETTSCEILYAPPSGNGLIFNAVYTSDAGGFVMFELIFAGDAG